MSHRLDADQPALRYMGWSFGEAAPGAEEEAEEVVGARSGTHATARSAKARRVKPSGNLKRYVEAGKAETRILTPLQRHRLSLPQDIRNGVVRRHDVIHPSYLASGHFCPRAQYFMLTVPVTSDAPSFQLDNIFEEGHYIHDKWQGYAWDIGVLAGMYKCVGCKHTWLGIAPTECPECHLDREGLRYLEVRVEDPEHCIEGSGDGWIVDN